MNFQKDHIYHVFNQGKDRQNVFFKLENYLFFLKKVKIYLAPYVDVLASGLMPNHSHLMIRVREVEVSVVWENHGVSQSHPVIQNGKGKNLQRIYCHTIRSNAWAINKQENFSGSLFREGSKAEWLNSTDELTPSFFNIKSGTEIIVDQQQFNYPQGCFNYNHQNPVKAGLIEQDIDWGLS